MSIRVYETVLYADDVGRAAAFYAEILGLPLLSQDDLVAAIRMRDGGLLLLFDPDRSSVPGRAVPAHGARGPGHVAFAVDPGGLDEVVARLRERGVEIEREVGWAEGGRSIYVRDPAGNSVEVIEGEAWPG